MWLYYSDYFSNGDKSARTGTPPVDKQRSYKGHPQPEVNERLVQAKNFLADEDINRCLGFTSKLLEIKEYVKYVETETIDWDADLLNNVKVMARVHRDWIKSQNDPPPDIIYYDAPSIQPYSSRLICADTAAALQAEKEAMGVATQMREDHPPFTVSREDDHATFMKALNDDTRANPDTIDTKNNLFWVENRAYLGALNEPAMVPVWMHPRAGLPKKGIVDGEQQPWYRRPVGNTLSLQPLPDYLQHHQDEVNRLLVESSTENGDYDAAKLQSLLSLYEPPHLKALRATCSSLLVKEASNTLAPDEVALLTFVRSECDTSCREWMKNLQKSGVRIVVSPLTAIEGNLSGVFYVPEVKPLPTDVAQLKDTQDIINGHLQKDQATLPDECKDELEKLLEPFLPLVLSGLRKTMNNIFAASKRAGISFLTFSNMAEANRLRTAFVQGFEKWTDSLRASGVRLRFFRPGEMQDHQPGVFYRNLDQVNSTPSVGLEDPEETMRALEPQINNLLLKLVGNNFVSEDYDALFNLLSHVTYPDLRNKLFYVRVLKAKMQASAGDLIAYGTLSQEYNSLWPDVLAEYDEWVDSFKHSVVVLRMPQEGHVDERPGVAYDRQDPAHDNPGVILALQAQLNDSLEKREDQRKQAENRWLTQSLQSLFYPRLKLIWDKVESLRTLGVLNQGESGLKDQLESDFSDLYDPWLKSLKYFGIKIRRSSFNGDPLEGDPTLLYYRGPPDPPDMTDPLSPPEIAAMLRQRKDDGLLENIEIVTVMQNYLPKNIRANLVLFQNMTLTWRNTSIWMSRRRALVGEFLEWAAKQQQLASLPEFPAPSISPQDSNLPPESQLPQYLQEQESLIQTLLQDLNPGLEGNQTLDEVLYDYWQPHLLRLQELRKHQLRSEGRSEAEIAGISMTDGYFRNQFESFKTMCRAYGFKIVEGPPGVFSAQDPNRPLSTTIKRLSRNSSRRDYSGRQYTRNGPGNGATGNGTSGNGSSGWNANTGENSTSGHQEPGHNDGLEPLPIQIQKIEDEINEFLRQSRVRSLSFYEHDKLSKLLQCVMYPSLVELTESIRELDEKARDRLLPGLEPLEFYTLWQRWYGEFEAWTRTFPEPGITIRIPEPGQEPSQDSGVLYLQVWNPWDLPPVSRAQDLPRHVQKVEDKLNRYLNPIRALAEEEEKELNVMMRPIWRPIGVAFRQQIINDMQRQEPGKENTPEGSAILEERLSSYYQAWKDQQRHCAVKICESQRGNFSTKLVQTPETLDLVEDPNLAQIIPQGIIDAEAEIWPLAKLATNMDPSALTNAQCATLSSLLEPISLARVARLKDLVSTLINKFRAKGELTAQEHRKLKEHFSDLVWQRYGYSHPSLREKFLLRLCYPDPTELLSWSGLPASEPLPKPLPILVPPTPSEIQTLEDLINDLLRRYRDNTLVGREGVKLDYLLRPLLPENLQSIRLRIKYYERKLLESQGLDTNESLLLAECTRQFDIEHQKWKDSLPNLFVRLDTLWQPQSVVKEIFARTAFLDDILSRQVNTTLDRGISTPSRVAEMEAWRETDRILRDYVRDIHNLRAEQPEELLLLSVPTSVARLYDAIGTISPDPTVGGIDTAAQLDRTRQQFIREYMDWYMSLSVSTTYMCDLRLSSNFVRFSVQTSKTVVIVTKGGRRVFLTFTEVLPISPRKLKDEASSEVQLSWHLIN
jgi:hypothetical protein